MYRVTAPAVYVTEHVYRDPRAVARMERMLPHIDAEEVRRVTDAELDEILAQGGLLRSGRTGQAVPDNQRVIIFNTFAWQSPEEIARRREQYPHLVSPMMLGQGQWGFRDASRNLQTRHGVCQSAHELHCASGCFHGCQYCHIRSIVTIMLNLEEYVERLDAFIQSVPSLELFKYDNQTDQICFEPEYGASELMVTYFAGLADRYLLLYTKSDNVDHLLDLPHNGHTIVNWSMSCEPVAREVERNTPANAQRIEAAARCQQAGYTVRARFSPIVPVADWRDAYAATIAAYLQRVQPDLVTLDVLGWMDAEMLRGSMNLDGFDPAFRADVEAAEREGRRDRGKPFWPTGKQLFSHDRRAAVYRFFIDEIRKHDPGVRIAICMETPEMWAAFGDELGMGPSNYVCCCGPTSVPGNPLLA